MNHIDTDAIDASLSMKNHITRLYAGKALPSTDKNLVCVLSPCTDVSLASLCMYLELLKQNVYNTDIKCVIVSPSFTGINEGEPSEYFSNLLTEIRESAIGHLRSAIGYLRSAEAYMDRDIIEVVDVNAYSSTAQIKAKIKSKSLTTIKKMNIDAKSLLCVIDNKHDDIMNIISTFNPDIIIFNNLLNQIDLITKMMNFNRDTSIISFTTDESDIQSIPKNHQYEILYKTSTCFEKISSKAHYMHLDLMKIIKTNENNDNETDKVKNIMAKLNSCINHVERQILLMNDEAILTKKIVVVLDSTRTMNTMYNHYKSKKSYYDCLVDIEPYNSSNHDDVIKFSMISPYTNTYNNHGILFIDSNDANNIFNIENNVINNIDFLIVLDENFKQNQSMYQRFITSLVSHILPKQHLVFAELAEMNLHQHLHRLSKTFYDNSATNVQMYNELKMGIESGMIRLDVNFNDMRQNKLERTLKITEADRRFDNRFNIIFMVTVPRSPASTIHCNYEIEKAILDNELSDDVLLDEYHAIAKSKKGSRNIPKYSGAKWISRNDKTEIAGNKIGFINDKTNSIEICEIIGVLNYTRREKRPDWKEKECKGKNILFLSSVRVTYELSEFKKEMKINKADRIEYMKEFTANLI